MRKLRTLGYVALLAGVAYLGNLYGRDGAMDDVVAHLEKRETYYKEQERISRNAFRNLGPGWERDAWDEAALRELAKSRAARSTREFVEEASGEAMRAWESPFSPSELR
ncbi:MAG: hypothetical protein CMH64_00620 [Nanoarchaeota archaeon]|nr:hypothetical protein [Nanoarchaeota archaeon]|tara:strand:- start:2527 stop:2853 length:327 start_codon:yes stop_codon:yes gene_type:complete